MFNIVKYGAVADGKTLNTAAIQAAIDACAAAGGGRVTIPAGVFKSGTIWLRSFVELHLENGAVLLASDRLEDYNDSDAYPQNFDVPSEDWLGKHLIIAHELEHAAITGFGILDGNCYAFVEDVWEHPGWFRWRSGVTRVTTPSGMRPGQLVAFVECSHVDVQDITIRRSGCWSVFLHGCRFVNVRGIKVHNPINMLNSDGIDIDTCCNVTVSDCMIETGDDGITLRCDRKRLKNQEIQTEYITITNCVIHTNVCGFRIGVGSGHIRHVRISNIVISRCRELLQFCTAYNTHGHACIEDLYVSGVSATDTDRMISMFASNGTYVKDVCVENVRTTACAMSYIEVNDGQIDNIRLRNVEIRAFDRYEALDEDTMNQRGHYVFHAKGATNLILEDVRIYGDFAVRKEKTCIEDCPDAQLRNCRLD